MNLTYRSPVARLLLPALITLALAQTASAADPSGLDLRLNRPATAADLRLAQPARPAVNEQALSDLVLQIQQLQQEVSELRGLVENQQYQLQQLQSGSGPRFGSAPRLSPDGASAGGQPIDALGELAPRQGVPVQADTATPPVTGVPKPLAPTLPTDRATGLLGLPAPELSDNAEARGVRTGVGLLGLPAPENLAGGERENYKLAFDALKERDYPKAKKGFETVLNAYPEGEFAESARYWLGEIGYVTQDYPTALTQFNRLVTDYPTSPKVPAALLKVGYVHFERKDLDQARAVLQEVVNRYPDSTEARLAQGRLERMGRE